MRVLGVDMGTTTISIVLADCSSGTILEKRTISHGAFIQGGAPYHKIQDADRMVQIVSDTVGEMQSRCGKAQGIGFSGQMHGMLYIDRDGNAVSPLYTWQDGSGNVPVDGGKTCSQILGESVGAASSGFGLTTHFYLQKTGAIPANAWKMVTISDYAAMRLTGRKSPLIGRDMAASWGCFDLENGAFRLAALERAGVDTAFLPEVTGSHSVAGETAGGCAVLCSLGDNQASVIGSLDDMNSSVLLNIGTGSQVSLGCDRFLDLSGSIDLRPCGETGFILVGSGLCGGRAYAMLEKFYETVPGMEKSDLYAAMQTQAEEFLKTHGKNAAWQVRTTFSGTRHNPDERGSIQGIGIENFTPGAMTVGVMQGILGELYEEYVEMCRVLNRKAAHLVGSGNGIRRNPLMRQLAEEMFALPLRVPAHEEEAAFGAALCAMERIGAVPSLADAQKMIRYL
ncbi:MAG: hypothetical protein IKE30_03500 [Clostridia bacterium]|nr:hypothetical protein [Clostridia bacterium]